MIIKSAVIAALLFTSTAFANTATINGQTVKLQPDQTITNAECSTLTCAILADPNINFIEIVQNRFIVPSKDDAKMICTIARDLDVDQNVFITVSNSVTSTSGSCATY